MRELLLLRHAKSSWDQPGLPDRERDLVPRGMAAAARMGALLRDLRLTPDLVMCSTARRAMRTWQLASEQLHPPPTMIESDALYLAAPKRMQAVVRGSGGAARRLLLVGHNPGMHAFANRLTATGDVVARGRLAEKFPTAGLALIGFAIRSWADLRPGSGELLGFWRPRDLADPPG
jgi:phosphohistidine phosphatase